MEQEKVVTTPELPEYDHDIEFRRLCRLISHGINEIDMWNGKGKLSDITDIMRKDSAEKRLEADVKRAYYCLLEDKLWMKFLIWFTETNIIARWISAIRFKQVLREWIKADE